MEASPNRLHCKIKKANVDLTCSQQQMLQNYGGTTYVLKYGTGK